ncbi:hypothetical protein L1049_006213 [Liquidambar formosana]|uniref:Uncharacterized protein n=1 Tax=Liquidambar formosana TaxID=63359 RepID=A0AAP0RGN3_LIQFO
MQLIYPFQIVALMPLPVGYGLRNVVDKQKAMQEVFRVLKPGSRVSVLDFNKSTQPLASLFQVARGYGLAKEYEYLKSSIHEFLSGKELEKLALDSGFSSAKHYEIGGGLMGNLVATR